MTKTIPLVAAASLLALAGCTEPEPIAPQRPAPVAAPTAPAAPAAVREQITISRSSCFGVCPVFTVTVSSDGQGIWEGRQNVAYVGKRPFSISPEQFAALTQRIDKWRPTRRLDMGGGSPVCRMLTTDQATTRIVWSGPEPKRVDELILYHGCDMTGKGTMLPDVLAAPGLLPISGFVGRQM